MAFRPTLRSSALPNLNMTNPLSPVNSKALIAYAHVNKTFSTALQLAVKLYKKDKRQWSGVPYVSHAMTVASLLLEIKAPADIMVVAALQDMLQRNALTEAVMRKDFGDAITDMVVALSKPKVAEGEDANLAFFNQLASSTDEVKTVKLASLLDMVCAVPRKKMADPAVQALLSDARAILPSLVGGSPELNRRVTLILRRASEA